MRKQHETAGKNINILVSAFISQAIERAGPRPLFFACSLQLCLTVVVLLIIYGKKCLPEWVVVFFSPPLRSFCSWQRDEYVTSVILSTTKRPPKNFFPHLFNLRVFS